MDRGHGPELHSMQGLGYKHFADCFSGKTSREEAITLLKRDTKRFAKRQFTWFRREPDAAWVDITGLTQPEDIVDRIKKNIEISK
jgi:tRNA dimethylallyltransferase